jgi:ribosomal-protein-alanine N-acetyltransferase
MTGRLDPRDVSLLLAGPDRAAQIAELHAQLFDPAWSEASVLQLLDHPAAAAYVALAGTPKAAIGYVMSQIAGDEAEILSIGVVPAHQRRGVGVILLEGLVRALKRAEIRRLFLEVAAGNQSAAALYSRLGFREIGRRKAYYHHADARTEDAVNLALEI